MNLDFVWCRRLWQNLFLAGLQPATFRVLGGRDNHYTSETCMYSVLIALKWHLRHVWNALQNRGGCRGNRLGCFCHLFASNSCCWLAEVVAGLQGNTRVTHARTFHYKFKSNFNSRVSLFNVVKDSRETSKTWRERFRIDRTNDRVSQNCVEFTPYE